MFIANRGKLRSLQEKGSQRHQGGFCFWEDGVDAFFPV